MKELIKLLDAELTGRKLHANVTRDLQALDFDTIRLMELRAKIELAQQIEYLIKAVRDTQQLLRARL